MLQFAENAGSSLTLTAQALLLHDEDITVAFQQAGTGTEGTDYGTISDITISAGQLQELLHLLLLMTQHMKEMKQVLLLYQEYLVPMLQKMELSQSLLQLQKMKVHQP